MQAKLYQRIVLTLAVGLTITAASALLTWYQVAETAQCTFYVHRLQTTLLPQVQRIRDDPRPPGLTRALEMLREGDTLVIWKLDRLERSVKQLIDMVGELHRQGIQFKSLTDAIDTGTPAGRFFFHVMASLAEMERELIIERTRAGLDAAKQLGCKGGRKPKMTSSKIESAKKLLASGIPPREGYCAHFPEKCHLTPKNRLLSIY